MLLTIVIFLLILGVLILSHELGHFWAARFNGIKVEEFGFGYPPRLFGLQLFKSRRLEKVAEEEVMTVEHTEGEVGQEVDIVKDVVKEVDVLVSKRKWRFVWGAKGVERLREENAGQDGTVYSINLLPLGGFCKIKGEEGGDGKESDSYDTKKPWQKAMVMAGGVVMNILLAAVLLSVGFMIGLPQSTSELSDVSNVQERKLQILSVLPDKPAVQAGIKAGDAIVQLEKNKKYAFERIAKLCR